MRQRLLVIALLLTAAALVTALVVVPRMGQSAVLSGYVEGEPLTDSAAVHEDEKYVVLQRPNFLLDRCDGRGGRSESQ